MLKKLAERKMKTDILNDLEMRLLDELTFEMDNEEYNAKLDLIKKVRETKDLGKVKIDPNNVLKGAVTIGCVLLTLHYEADNVITTKLWSKVKF